MQTTFLWLKSNTFGLYFNFLDYAELIIFVVIILTTIIVCMFLLLANEVKSAIKVFLIGALSIILPVSLLDTSYAGYCLVSGHKRSGDSCNSLFYPHVYLCSVHSIYDNSGLKENNQKPSS